MAKQVQPAIQPTREENFSEWYQQVIVAANLADHSEVRGCMIIKPWGYAIWEAIQADLDRRFKATGHQNAYFPLLIPLSHLEKEAEHADGFAKECAVVTHHSLEQVIDSVTKKPYLKPVGKLSEPYVIRPTSETIIGSAFSRWINSYRDLPLLINQWANVMRWEMRPRLFLRTAEFLWQEGHTAHATASEAIEEASAMHQLYDDFLKNILSIPVIAGEKSVIERFPGAENTLTVEAMVQDKKAIQAGTSHYLGQTFSKAQNISFIDSSGNKSLAYTTSWGVSTRLIGTLIMAHSDDNGLVLPPAIAPQQIIILPIIPKAELSSSILEVCQKLLQEIQNNTYLDTPIRAKIDKRDINAGHRKWEWIKKGVPILLEIGSKDLDKSQVCLQRRDSLQKEFIPNQSLMLLIPEILAEMQSQLLAKATAFRDQNIEFCEDLTQFESHWSKNQAGWLLTHWQGEPSQEETLAKTYRISIRCLPQANQLPSHLSKSIGHCFLTSKPTKQLALWARSY